MALLCLCFTGTDEEPVPGHFRVEEAIVGPFLKEGQVLVRTLFLSVDPYMVMHGWKEKLKFVCTLLTISNVHEINKMGPLVTYDKFPILYRLCKDVSNK